MLDEHDEDERRQQCLLCKKSSCRHLVGQGDSKYMEWSGGVSDVPEVWALISQAPQILWFVRFSQVNF